MRLPIASARVPKPRPIIYVHVLYLMPRTKLMPKHNAKKAKKKALAPRLG